MLRPKLGDFSSIICFKAAIVGMEDALGEKATAIALISAGRQRGKSLAKELGLEGLMSLEDVVTKLRSALGEEGTKLCIVESISEEGGVIKVYTSETLCSADEEEGSPRKCTYTMGAVWGALEQSLGKRFQGKHTESVLRGGKNDVFEFVEFK
ncbi:MAG: hydrocarbon-binding protein [Rivularia sp. (in: cyanobacteria)]